MAKKNNDKPTVTEATPQPPSLLLNSFGKMLWSCLELRPARLRELFTVLRASLRSKK